MALKNLVNIGSGNGLLPDSTKPFPQQSSFIISKVQCHSFAGDFTQDTPATNQQR